MANVVDKEAIPSLDYLKNPFAKPSYDARLKDTQYEYYHPVSRTKIVYAGWSPEPQVTEYQIWKS